MDLLVTRADPAIGHADDHHLTSLIAIVASTLFLTLLSVFTGEIGVLWPLYLAPILIAALSYGVPGAVTTATLCAGIVALVLPGVGRWADHLGVVVGFVIFLGCGVAVGVAANRNRRLVRTAEQASIYDPETGLFKPGTLRERLAEEAERGVRHGYDVALLIVRIDDLPRFREQFGAYKTGLLFEHLAAVVSIAVRGTDVVGRFAPDALAVIAPFTAPSDAAGVAERVERAVGEAAFEGDVLEPATRCSATVVWASAPQEATGPDGLVGLAEERLEARP
ncbi:MAG: diguanylate cyclase [Coriobacteriia bacterium]|nr:diguanylate cyclase [Coriobacteriia bacterium]